MPTYEVRLTVNIPGVGNRNVVQPDIVAATIEEAIAEAKRRVMITTVAAQQTAP